MLLFAGAPFVVDSSRQARNGARSRGRIKQVFHPGCQPNEIANQMRYWLASNPLPG
jgi:hypothetical protein